MASYYLIWSILFTSFSLLAAYDLILTFYKTKKSVRIITYIVFECIILLGYLYLMSALFSPIRVNEGFETPYKYIVIVLNLLLWSVKFISLKRKKWILNTVSLKDALKENREICYLFDSKGRLVQGTVEGSAERFWHYVIQDKDSFLTACIKNAYEEDFLTDPQLKIKLFTEQTRKIVSFKKDLITNNKDDIIGEIWTGTDITELQNIFEALKASQNELIEAQSVLVNYLALVEDYERTKAEQDIALRMNELIGHEMMTLLKQLQLMEITIKEDDTDSFNKQLNAAILSCKAVIQDVRKTVQLISSNNGEAI